MSTAPPFRKKPLSGQRAFQRRVGMDDEAFDYYMRNACHFADALRETGAPPFGCWIMALQALGLLAASSCGPNTNANDLVDAVSSTIRENMADIMAMAINLVQEELPSVGGGGENALETAYDNRVNPAGAEGDWRQ